ncbi:MAG TPA: guanylate kinase, partial [Blastocatellia bacterium]|nr:guanylate kinase [Blastocatellia bacterium]
RALEKSPGECSGAKTLRQDRGQRSKGNLIVVTAPSGAGKSSLVERSLLRLDLLRYSVSYTTRQARGSERDGVNYFFVSEVEFQKMRERGEFLECAEVHGHLYGTHRATIEKMMDEGFDVILDIDVQGAGQIRRQMSDAVTIFVLPPSREVLESRLRARNLNTAPDLERRLRNAVAEVRAYGDFKYVIINDDLDRATAALEAIIVAERHRMERQKGAALDILSTFGGESSYA